MTVPAPFCPAHPGGTFEACDDCAKARGKYWDAIAVQRARRIACEEIAAADTHQASLVVAGINALGENRLDLVVDAHDSPSIGGPDAPTSVLAAEPIVGVASGARFPSAPDAFPTTRAERLVLAAEVVPLHDFTQPGAPLTGYRARLQGEHITPRWIGGPHRTRAAAERDIHDLIRAAL